MDIEKLIERLKQKDGLWCSVPTGENLIADAATALSTLQAENEKLRNEVERQRRSADDRKHLYENAERAYMKVVAELEQVKRERDAAVKDLNEFLAMDELCPIQCEWCKWKDTFCDGKTPEWRGQKED